MSVASVLVAPEALDGQLIGSLPTPKDDSVGADAFDCHAKKAVALPHANTVDSGHETAVFRDNLSELDFAEPTQDFRFIQRRRYRTLPIVRLTNIWL